LIQEDDIKIAEI